MSLRNDKQNNSLSDISLDIPFIAMADDLFSFPFQRFDFGDKYKYNNMHLYENNLHLIEQCVATKNTDIICKEDLEKEAKVALLDAALNFHDSKNFKQTALAKIERALSTAIAEKYFLNNLTKDTETYMNIYCEMHSIHYRFSTLYV